MENSSSKSLQKIAMSLFVIGVVIGTLSGICGFQTLGIIGVLLMLLGVVIVIIGVAFDL